MNKTTLFGLVDCNNFYASCERVFRPKLRGRPIIVLSNNDGCVIARSNEAKALNITMGQPYFECEKTVKQHKVVVFSSNFSLYGDFSNRVMNTLEMFAPELEIYSIDEAFINLTGLPENNLVPFAKNLKNTVKKWTGIPVSIGIGPTKTLAKLANRIAKKQPEYDGVFNITNHPLSDEIMKKTDTGSVWGIGYRLRKHLSLYGITNVLELKNSPDEWIKKNFSINVLHTVHELRGESRMKMEEKPETQKSIITSRSFRKPLTELSPLKEAIATFTSRAVEKLREQNCVASYIQAYLSTGHHQAGLKYRQNKGMELPSPSSSTPDFIAAAHTCLKTIFRQGYGYKKAGVMITGITPKRHQQLDLFTPLPIHEKKEQLMKIMDETNWRWGTDTLMFGAGGVQKTWRFRQEKRSPNYTTQWKDLLTIKIGPEGESRTIKKQQNGV